MVHKTQNKNQFISYYHQFNIKESSKNILISLICFGSIFEWI